MRRAWLFVFVGILGLVSMRVAYNLSNEPAPGVRVRWRDGTSDTRRRWLEIKYRLTDAAAPEGLSVPYVLHDTSTRNIAAMVKDPEVADTADIDRVKFEVPFETAQYSVKWMWVADRIPGLRQPLVRWGLVIAFAALTVTGIIQLVLARRSLGEGGLAHRSVREGGRHG